MGNVNTPHKHKHTEIRMFRLVDVHVDYNGTAGDKAILTRVCSCGAEKAFEFGAYKDMLKLQYDLKQAGSKE